MKRIKRGFAKLVVERRCVHIVNYTTYPKQGIRSDRHGRCSRWTYRTCGLCMKHCVMRIGRHHCDIRWKRAA